MLTEARVPRPFASYLPLAFPPRAAGPEEPAHPVEAPQKVAAIERVELLLFAAVWVALFAITLYAV